MAENFPKLAVVYDSGNSDSGNSRKSLGNSRPFNENLNWMPKFPDWSEIQIFKWIGISSFQLSQIPIGRNWHKFPPRVGPGIK